MKNKGINKRYFIILPIAILILAVGIVVSFSASFADPLEDGVRVEENSDLSYYIDVIYDGKDSQAVSSSDEATSDVYSDYIYVEDKLPEGLTFKEFISSGGDTIGAVKRSDSTTSCSGYVVDGYNGLKYDEETHTISFKVKSLQAGCKLTVGVVTTTPSLGHEVRMDFYNTANGRENNFTAQSNTVHVFMGNLSVTTYPVHYEFVGDVIPDNVTLPTDNSYYPGATVGVEGNPMAEGYVFSGWSSDDVEVVNGTYTMPDHEVTFTGSFTKAETYQVSYRIDGEAPDIYNLPSTQEYSAGSDVEVDSLKTGEIIDGYRFLGWTTTTPGVEFVIDGNDVSFVMPSSDVELVGHFEKVVYSVTYQFQGTNIPANGDSLLPAVEYYSPGDTVSLASNPSCDGYRFLGWYSNSTFTMPDHNVVIYGEWALQSGVFAPTISQEITNPKDRYEKGDIVEFQITITNPENYEIKDVMVESQYNLVEGDGYELMNEHYVKIPSIPARGSVVIFGRYEVLDNSFQQLENVAEILGAIADNNYVFDTSIEYKAVVEFHTGRLGISVNKIDKDGNSLSGASFSLYSDSNLTNEVGTGLVFDNLDINTTYYLKEVQAPDGYVLNDDVVSVVIDGEGRASVDGEMLNMVGDNYQIDIINQKQNFINSPNTIDSIITYIAIFIASCSVIVFVVYLLKNKKKVNTI